MNEIVRQLNGFRIGIFLKTQKWLAEGHSASGHWVITVVGWEALFGLRIGFICFARILHCSSFLLLTLQGIGKGSYWCVDPAFRPNLLQALRRTPYHPYHQLQMVSNGAHGLNGNGYVHCLSFPAFVFVFCCCGLSDQMLNLAGQPVKLKDLAWTQIQLNPLYRDSVWIQILISSGSGQILKLWSRWVPFFAAN